ncbi:MAG: hypothetical protein EPN37_09560 [Chitinophagaceae bacterium]|nr:MAG: hypothetical protein EPN37_09560 [Chitinophagaceae bacterium]
MFFTDSSGNYINRFNILNEGNYFGMGYNNGNTAFSINQSGNVGIGTTNPTGKLTVAGVSNYNNIQFTGNSSNGVGISIENTQSAGHKYDLFSSGSSDDVGSGDFAIYDETAGSYRFAISPSGNVLIGKTSQTNTAYKLDVNGNIRANQVTVNATGADYVLDSSYHLPSLDQLQNFIKANHHLPGIAPAKQMQSEGINLGNNQTQLLKKIKELTLYIIAEDKKNQQLQMPLNSLK